jgi:hypothetical protein
MSNIRTKSVSTNATIDASGAPMTAQAATSLLIAAAGQPVNILNISGYCYGTTATNYYLMFFNGVTVPANGAQPIFKQQLLGADGFIYNYMPRGLWGANLTTPPNIGGLIAVLSTSAETLTIATGALVMDLDVEIEEQNVDQPGTTTVGDLTTAVASLQVWAEAAGVGTANLNGAKKLLKVFIINKSGSDQYLQLFAQDDPVTNSATLGANVSIPPAGNGTVGGTYTQSPQVNSQIIPIQQWKIPNCLQTSGVLVPGRLYQITTFAAGDNFTNVGSPSNTTGAVSQATGATPTTWTNGSTLTAILTPMDFGASDSGLIPQSIDRGATTIRRGCSLFVSTTSGYLTVPGSSQWCIRAVYK